MKKLIKLSLAGMALATSALALTSCNKTKADYTIGILQYVSHNALDNASEGFKEAIKAKIPSGKTVEFVELNPQADATANQTMAAKLVRECDLVLGNATPAAQQLIAARATEGKLDLPLLFTSVTDPVAANLISDTNRNNNVTGTSDMNPVEDQMEMIFDLDPSVDKVGFLYTVSEINSQTQCEIATDYLALNHSDVTTETQTFAEASGINTAVTKLVNDGCDCIFLPTDNIVASNIPSVTNITNPAKVFTLAGEENMVSAGATITLSVNYKELGKTTGDMAIDILINGKDADEIEVEMQNELSKYIFAKNDAALQACDLTLSEAFKTKYASLYNFD